MDDGRDGLELYIDTQEKDENKRIFDFLLRKKQDIEKSFGAALSWERLDDKRACRIRCVIKEGGLTGESKWQSMEDAMIGAMDRLVKTIKPHLGRTVETEAARA